MTITAATTSESSIHANILSTYSCCHNCGYSHPHISAQQDNHATTVVPLATTLPYVSARGPSTSATLPGKVITVEVTVVPEAPGATNHPRAVTGTGTEDSAPTIQLCHCSPSHSKSHSLPTIPPTVHLPTGLNKPVTDVPSSSTPRTAWRSSQPTVLKPHLTPKVPC